MKERDRLWWAERQSLLTPDPDSSPGEALAKTGWSRSVGGANPYLAIHARCGAERTSVDEALARLDICELPSLRGCTYVVPREHFALALTLAQGTADKAPLRTAVNYLGVTEAEVDQLKLDVLECLGDQELDPRELRERLGSRVRNLGDEGRKRGQSTTLSLALLPLQTHGEIVRVPKNGRLDTERYGYRRWTDSPLAKSRLTKAEALTQFVRLYFAWAGPATVKQAAWITGSSQAAVRAACQEAGVVPLVDGRLIHADLEDPYAAAHACPTGVVNFLGSLDNLIHLRHDLSELISEPLERRAGTGAFGESTSHMIVRDGRLVGLWEYDFEAQELVAKAWQSDDRIEVARSRTEGMIRTQLGDCRSFSLDSPASRKPRLDALRARS